MSNDTAAQPDFIIEHLTEAQRDTALRQAEQLTRFLEGLTLPRITPLDGEGGIVGATTKRVTRAAGDAFALNRFMQTLTRELGITVVEPDTVET